MAHVLAPIFICTLAGKYGDHRDTCPLDGKCIKHGRICEYLEMKVSNAPRWRPPKVVVPPSKSGATTATTSSTNVAYSGGATSDIKVGKVRN